MAGVVAEIDLVLSQQALAKLEGDLGAASKQLGTGLAAGANPAAIAFSKNLIGTLQTRFAAESAVLAKQLAEGSLNPAQYSAAATRLGKQIAADLQRGIRAGTKLDLFGGEGGLALQNQLGGLSLAAPALEETTKQTEKLATAAIPAAAGMGRVRSALFILASQATGTNSALSSLASGLLLMGEGQAIALGAAAAIGIVAFGVDQLTKAAQKGRKAADDLIASLKNLGKTQFEILSGQINELNKNIADTEKRIKDIRDIQAIGKAAGGTQAVGPDGIVITGKQLQEELKRLDTLRDALRRVRGEAMGAGGSPVEVEQRGLAFLQGVSDQARKDEDEAARKRKEAAAERKRQQEENLRLLKDEAQRQLQIAEDQRQLSVEAQTALAQLTTTTVDDLQLQLSAFETRALAVFGHLTPETQKVIDGFKQKIEQTKLLEPIDRELQALAEKAAQIATFKGGAGGMDMLATLDQMVARLTAQRDKLQEGTVAWQEWETRIKSVLGLEKQLLKPIGDASIGVEKFGTDWAKIGETIATVGQGILDLGRGLGIVSNRTEKVLQGFISIGKNLPKALAGDPAAIIGVIGGAVSTIGGVFGFHKSKDPERFAQNQAWYEAAIGGDANALEQLRIHSVVAAPGRPGWGSGPAAADASAKYQQAKGIVDAAAAPGLAKDAADAAAKAEQDRLDKIRASEEGQVAARTETERRQHITDLLGGGGPADLTNKLDALEKEFERLVAASPLGEDSPLARDAKRRADDAARDLENATDAAKQEAARIAGDQITPGFTVQRTLTETSAGRLIGELTTQSVWLEKIYGVLAGVGPGATAGAAGLPAIQVFVGGEEVAAVVSRGQAASYQRNASLQGNASLPA